MRQQRMPARQLAEVFRGVLDPLVRRRGLVTAELIGRWQDIVGVELGAVCAPVKVVWPKRQGEEGSDGGTLVVRAGGSDAFLVRQQVDMLRARLNGFFGFMAIDTIKVVRAERPPEAPEGVSLPAQPLDEPRLCALEGVEDPALLASLKTLGANIAHAARLARR